MTADVVIAVRGGPSAKSRLAGVMTAAAREQLVEAMLADMLAAVARWDGFSAIHVVTPTESLADLARAHGAQVIHETEAGDLNSAFELARTRIGGTGPIVLLPGDLPGLQPDELSAVIAAWAPGRAVLVPASADGGTGALVIAADSALNPAFGRDSAERHRNAADACDLAVESLDAPSLAFDLDRPADIQRAAGLEGRTGALLRAQDGDLRRRLLEAPLADLMSEARGLRDARASALTYSRKVFVPLTQLCRDVCHYCTFAKAPKRLHAAYLTPDEVMEIARQGAVAGCKEVLFTLGDKPELRYAAARDALAEMGFATTLDYLEHIAGRVLAETGLVPHINAGILTAEDYARLRKVSGSMGLMLESSSARLSEKGGPHYGSPDKDPAVRLASIAAAGEAKVPFTSGILIGIGETRDERIDALVALRDLHRAHGHLQEVIIQNFRAKPGTKMADAPEPSEDELLWTLAAARLVLDAEVSVQAPPNLNPGRTTALIAAGLNDWGGISPVTIDHVNPEAPWPEITALGEACHAEGFPLIERLTVYPQYVARSAEWLDAGVAKAIRKLSDAEGLGRDTAWSPGVPEPAPASVQQPLGVRFPALHAPSIDRIIAKAEAGQTLATEEIVRLFEARDGAAQTIVTAADELRRKVRGDTVTYVVNRNINYTNICTYSCSFCAFSKTSTKAGTRDKPYDLPLDEVAGRAREAWAKGATEVCLQGGIHPKYTGETYVSILKAVKQAEPGMHVHAFSPLEVSHGAETTGVSVSDYLKRLRDEGLGSLPGTAAEILDDEVRAVICPDKLNTGEWLDVVGAAHRVGLPTTATIMFGHLDRPEHWARHLLAIRNLQLDTGGFTEFVPLPFVHMQSPVYVRGQARKGPTWRETVLMHAISRLALNGAIDSIQVSWVKLGLEGAAACLAAGVNDLGGVLMNESISRAAGASHGQEVSADDFRQVTDAAGRTLKQRTTLYGEVTRPPVLTAAE